MRDGLGDLHPSRLVARRMHELETELQRARMHLRRHSKSADTLGRWNLDQPAPPQQEEAWFVTYLDMMTLLLVVMIVMLAFSGTIGSGAGKSVADAPAIIASAPVTDITDPPTTTVIVESVELPAAPVLSDHTDTAAATVEASNAAAAEATTVNAAGGTGVLPGGSGLLPGHAAAVDTLAVAEAYPGWSAAGGGALPPDAAVLAGRSAPLPSAEQLYPGWSSADLAASFIGPPRPRTELESATVAAVAETTAGEDLLSEGETLAAGLSLAELGSDVEVVVNERSVSFRVNSEILFDSSQADLSRSGLAVLRRIVGVLADAGHEITVEGHTDSVAVRRNIRYPSNWELSSARAGSVVRYLQANGIASNRLKAVGYADTRPIADNHTPEGRASNRRVELLIEKRN